MFITSKIRTLVYLMKPLEVAEKVVLHMMGNRHVEPAKGHCRLYKVMEVSEGTASTQKRSHLRINNLENGSRLGSATYFDFILY